MSTNDAQKNTSRKDPQRARNVCIIRLSALGDVCNAIAIVQEIQRQWPDSSITWIIGKAEFFLVKNLRNIEFIVFDKLNGIFAYFDLLKQLKGRQFDALLHMQCALHANFVSLCVRATRKIGFDNAHAHKMQWLFTNEKIESQKQIHIIDSFAALAIKLGLTKFKPQWDIPLEEGALRWARFITSGKRYVLLSASASAPECNWSIEYYSEIVRYLTKAGFTVVLTSAHNQDEVDLVKKVYVATERKVINLAGNTSLQEMLALIQKAEFIISPDSGPVHMAVMLNVPVIGIYAHRNPQRAGPWRFHEYTVTHYESNILQQHRKPTSQLPWGIRANGAHLMQGIKPAEVIQKIKLILKHDCSHRFNY